MKTVILSNLLSGGASPSNLVGQVEFLILLLIVTLVEGESIFNDGTAGAAYELVLAVLLPTLGLVEASGNPSFLNTPILGIAGEVLWLIFGGLLLGIFSSST